MKENTDRTPFIDIHSHQPTDPESLTIISYDACTEMPRANHTYYSFGLHPWFIAADTYSTALQTLTAVGSDLCLLAIGECGLDKTISLPMPTQMRVFEAQIALAQQTGKPLIIHCVKAFNELIQLKKTRDTGTAWIIHGFTGKPELAAQLLKQQFYFSFGKALMLENSHAARTLINLPLDKLFFETDAEDIPISRIYLTASKILGLDEADLRRQIFSNFQRVFK